MLVKGSACFEGQNRCLGNKQADGQSQYSVQKHSSMHCSSKIDPNQIHSE